MGHASETQTGIKNPNGTKCWTYASMVTKTKVVRTIISTIWVIHTDLVSPMYNEYAIVSADHHSKVIISYILASRKEASEKAIATVKTFNNLLEQFNKSIYQNG